ncbi:MAG: high-potential iron-sulfur protein [Deltaproteobacteria bacterium]|nr:high-potential iron-sulfur protein [Deltaproteobacteria bacterium]
MKSTDNVSRRKFLGFGLTALVAAPVAASLLTARSATAQADLPKVDEADPVAQALGFKADAATVDVAKFPKRAGEAGAKQFCHSCALFQGKEGDEFAPCTMFPGKAVAKGGWCNAWAPKAA